MLSSTPKLVPQCQFWCSCWHALSKQAQRHSTVITDAKHVFILPCFRHSASTDLFLDSPVHFLMPNQTAPLSKLTDCCAVHTTWLWSCLVMGRLTVNLSLNYMMDRQYCTIVHQEKSWRSMSGLCLAMKTHVTQDLTEGRQIFLWSNFWIDTQQWQRRMCAAPVVFYKETLYHSISRFNFVSANLFMSHPVEQRFQQHFIWTLCTSQEPVSNHTPNSPGMHGVKADMRHMLLCRSRWHVTNRLPVEIEWLFSGTERCRLHLHGTVPCLPADTQHQQRG